MKVFQLMLFLCDKTRSAYSWCICLLCLQILFLQKVLWLEMV